MTEKLFKQTNTFRGFNLIFLVFLFVGIVSSQAAKAVTPPAKVAPPDLDVEIVNAIKPNPALIGEGTTTELRAHLYKKGTKEEIFPDGTSVNWSCTNWANASFNPASTGHNQVTTMSASFPNAKSYTLTVKATAANSNWTTTPIEKTIAVTITVSDVTVTFSPATLRTGYWADGKKDIFTNVTATVTPARAADKVTIQPKSGTDTDGQTLDENVRISDTTSNTTTGLVTFKLRGTGASTAKGSNGSFKTNGNTIVEGLFNSVGKGSMRVCVVVPASIQRPTPPFDADVTGVNTAINGFTSPAVYVGPNMPLPNSSVNLVTLWATFQTITVLDQFEQGLDSIYNGAQVNEYSMPINQTISSGTYLDPVGPPMKKEVDEDDPSNLNPARVANDDTPGSKKSAWIDPTNTTRVMPDFGTYPGDFIPVAVGGHPVGNIKRDVTLTSVPGSSTKIHIKITDVR